MKRIFQALRSLGFSPPALEDVFIEMADGVVQIVPPAFWPTLRALALPAKLVAALRASPASWLEECRTLVALAHRIDQKELSTLSEEDLLDRIERLQRLQVELFVRRFGYFPRGMLITQGLSFLLRLAVGRQAPKIETNLLAGVPCKTTEVNQELGRLARQIRGSAGLRQVFQEESPEHVPARLRDSAAGRAFLAKMETFLHCYGYRETGMPAAALPAWRDDPSVVYGLLKGLVAGSPPTPPILGGTGALHTDSPQAEVAPRRGDWGDGGVDWEAEEWIPKNLPLRGDRGRAEQAKQEVVAALSRGRFGLGRRLLLPLFLKALEATGQ